MREHLGDLLPVQAVNPQVVADSPGDVTGATIDMQGFDSLMLIGSIGAEGDTLGTQKFYFEVEHSDDDSANPGTPLSWGDCANADLSVYVTGANTGTFATIDAAAEAPAIYWTTYRGGKRFVRVIVNEEGTNSTGTPASVVAIKGHPHVAPVTLPT